MLGRKNSQTQMLDQGHIGMPPVQINRLNMPNQNDYVSRLMQADNRMLNQPRSSSVGLSTPQGASLIQQQVSGGYAQHPRGVSLINAGADQILRMQPQQHAISSRYRENDARREVMGPDALGQNPRQL
jgi:hypothetical protein